MKVDVNIVCREVKEKWYGGLTVLKVVFVLELQRKWARDGLQLFGIQGQDEVRYKKRPEKQVIAHTVPPIPLDAALRPLMCVSWPQCIITCLYYGWLTPYGRM